MPVVNLRKAKYDIYIGRAGKGRSGYFGNPVARGKTCPECQNVHQTGGSTLGCYEEYLWRRIDTDPQFAQAVKSLVGKTLGCFCKPAPCHGDMLERAAQILNE